MPDRLGREIWQLSVAAFLALVTEPLFLLADAAIIGHLGTDQLAALGIASAVLGSLISLCIFLAYGTTAAVARYVGSGNRRSALAQGVDGIWLAVLLGVLVTAVTLPLTGPIIGVFGPSRAVAGFAAAYLHIALAGAVPMLVMLAAVGVLRGLKDLRTPLIVAVIANLGNIALNVGLVYGAGLGIAGSAWGSLIAQTGAAAATTAAVIRVARRDGAPLAPDLAGIRRAAHTGMPLFLRTLLLRVALLLMTYGAARFGSTELATMQLALTIWSFLAFALDALGIAAQTLVGTSLGEGRPLETRRLAGRLVRWGVVYGAGTGLALLACATVLARVFTSDPAVLDLLPPVLIVAALAQPVAGVVFVLDGVLIGADDGTFLAWAQALVLAVFAPAAVWVIRGEHGLVWLWIAFAGAFMGTRFVLLLARERGRAWLVAHRGALRVDR